MQVRAPLEDRYDEALTDGALALVGRLHEELDARRHELLDARQELQARLDAGESLDFVTAPSDFRVAPVPEALRDRRVEITGPTSRKMVINALNSGARGFMADFEDSNSPYWSNMVEGQVNLADAIRGSIEHDENGKHYELGDEPAVLHVRPRGLHLPEAHLQLEGQPVAGAFMDFGLYVHRNAEETLGLERGTIKATVLIETIPAAFEMDAILYELRDYAAGLNAGRWDYIFSVIKRFRSRPDFVLPDRSEVSMTVPFMKAYSDLVVKTSHARGAHAMGGMAAVIPSRTDEEANKRAFESVKADKEREANDGFDGTWVAHPDSVPVAMEAFDAVLGHRPNQVDKQRDDVTRSAGALLAVPETPGERTEQGLRSNVNVGIQYISSWLRGNGAAAIYGLMEDAATAEIARGQVWQWIRHEATLDDGRTVTPELIRELEGSELEKIRSEIGDDEWFEKEGRPDLSRSLFERVALSEEFTEFLTLPAYEELLRLEH